MVNHSAIILKKEGLLLMQQMGADNQPYEAKSSAYGQYEGNQSYRQQTTEGHKSGFSEGYDDDFMDAFAQRLSQRMAQEPPGKVQPRMRGESPSEHRLGLAIVSVIMLVIFAIALVVSPYVSWGAGLIILSIIALTTFLINAVFNRWWFN